MVLVVHGLSRVNYDIVIPLFNRVIKSCSYSTITVVILLLYESMTFKLKVKVIRHKVAEKMFG